MRNVLTKTLSSKVVMSSEGREIGTLYNITFDEEFGQLNQLIVQPVTNAVERQKNARNYSTDERNRIRVDASEVMAVEDCIIVQ